MLVTYNLCVMWCKVAKWLLELITELEACGLAPTLWQLPFWFKGEAENIPSATVSIYSFYIYNIRKQINMG